MTCPSPITDRRQRGAGLVETMVGILIGMLVILVVYGLLAAAENYKRATTGAADAQTTGLLSQFLLGRDAGNGGNGFALSAAASIQSPGLIDCTKDESGTALIGLSLSDPRTAVRPIPVLISDSGSDDTSDSIITMVSAAPHVLWGVPFVTDAAAGADFTVQTPTGFTAPLPSVTPYLAVVMDGTGTCTLTTITDASTPPGPQGQVTLKHGAPVGGGGWLNTYTAGTAGLVNLGPVGQATRTRYDVANNQLRTTDLFTAGAAPNPVAPNIVLMKAQYGVDTNADEVIDCWTSANTPAISKDPCADGRDYSDLAVRAFNLPNLNRIMAVRIGVVVESEEPDLKDHTLDFANRAPVTLFNCSANNNTCQSRIVLSNAVLRDGWRYRTYETVVPLRNVIYTTTLP